MKKSFLNSMIMLVFTLFCSSAAAQKFTVVSTFTVIADIAQNIAGEHADVFSITKAGAEIHDYEPTPHDLVTAQKAQLLLHNGLQLERWFERFHQSLKQVPAVTVSAGVTPIPIEGDSGIPNPHAWMSIDNALIYVDNITQALQKYDPEHANDYAENARRYKEKIQALDTHLQQAFAKIPEQQRWLVTTEGAFSYLARDYHLREAYVWPVNSEQEGTPQQIADLIATVRKHQIPVVFSESTLSDKHAKVVAKETGAQYGGVLYVDSLSTDDGAVPTYLDLLKVTTDTIISGFESALNKNAK